MLTDLSPVGVHRLDHGKKQQHPAVVSWSFPRLLFVSGITGSTFVFPFSILPTECGGTAGGNGISRNFLLSLSLRVQGLIWNSVNSVLKPPAAASGTPSDDNVTNRESFPCAARETRSAVPAPPRTQSHTMAPSHIPSFGIPSAAE